jgi:predicted SnoaL-like aldol condensation-catalyzing enzyme
MSAEQNMAVLSRFIEEVINQAHVDTLDTVMAPTYSDHADLPEGKSVTCEDLKRIIRHFRLTFPDWHETPEYLIAQDDLVFRCVLCHGTNTAMHASSPPRGKSLILVWSDVFRLTQGKIVEHWGFDWVGMMQQLTSSPVRAEKKSRESKQSHY